MKKVLLVVFVFLSLFAFNSAGHTQEAGIVLEEGQSVWSMLRDRGCSNEEAAAVWPMVFHDSGLDPALELRVPVGTPIKMIRDCKGQVAVDGQLALGTLREQYTKLLAREQMLLAEIDELKARTAELEAAQESGSSIAGSDTTWWMLALMPVMVAIGIGAGFYMAKIGRKEIEQQAVVTAQEGEDFPRVIDRDHLGEKYSFVRKENALQHRVWYECPKCSAEISRTKIDKHLRNQHPLNGEKMLEFPLESPGSTANALR